MLFLLRLDFSLMARAALLPVVATPSGKPTPLI
jgi:hypothetical protein